jgi:hypothetical protein
MIYRKLTIVFIVVAILTACSYFSSSTPIVEETKGAEDLPDYTETPSDASSDNDLCTQTHLAQWCVDFAVPLADGGMQVYLREKMDPSLSILPALMLAHFTGQEKFTLIDNLGNETEASQFERTIPPLNELPEIQYDLSLFFPDVGLVEGQSVIINIPFIGYKMPINGALSIPLNTASLDERIPIEQSIFVNNHEIQFYEASLIESDSSGVPIYVDGTRIEGAISGNVFPKETYLVVKGSVDSQDKSFLIAGLSVLDQVSGAAIDPVTGQVDLRYRLVEEEQHAETIEIQLVSAYVIEKGPFPISVTLPYGDVEKLPILTQYLSQGGEITEDVDLSTEVFVGLSSYSGDNVLLNETVGCILGERECGGDAKVISQSWTPNDVFQLSPDREAAVLVNNDDGRIVYYEKRSNSWQLLEKRFVYGPLVIWKQDSSGFVINTEVDTLEFWSVRGGQVVHTKTGTFPGLRQVIGWIGGVELLVAYETPVVTGTGKVLLGIYNTENNAWYPLAEKRDPLMGMNFSLSPQENTLLFNDTNISFLMALDTFEVVVLPEFPLGWLVWSPNGNMVASIINDDKCVVHLLNIDIMESKRLFETDFCSDFAWMPDSNYVFVVETIPIDDELNVFLVSTLSGISKRIPLPAAWQKYQLMYIY